MPTDKERLDMFVAAALTGILASGAFNRESMGNIIDTATSFGINQLNQLKRIELRSSER